jgi:hypothetical protein
VVTDAIAKLEAEDADAVRDAKAALNWLTAGAGLEVLTQERLQHFLWYGLPMKWLTDTDHHRRVVAALARAFDQLGLRARRPAALVGDPAGGRGRPGPAAAMVPRRAGRRAAAHPHRQSRSGGRAERRWAVWLVGLRQAAAQRG